MAENDFTPDRNSLNEPIHKGQSLSALHSIISNAHLLHQTGYDIKKHTATYVGNAKQLAYMESAADTAITTIGLGVSSIGKLIAGQDKTMCCLDGEDISAIGWLLNDLGASIVALQNIQTAAGDAVTAANR